MKMSCGGWTGGSNANASPRRNSLAYRRYLRFLPVCNLRDRHPLVASDPVLSPAKPTSTNEGNPQDSLYKMGIMGSTNTVGDTIDVPHKDKPRRREKEILREQGLSRWLKDQEANKAADPNSYSNYDMETLTCQGSYQPSRSRSVTDIEADQDSYQHRKDVADNDTDSSDVINVKSLVQQYTAMINARNSSGTSDKYNALQTSRSCSNLPSKTTKISRFVAKNGDIMKDGRNGSLDSGDGDSSDSLLGPRYRSFSLPWPSEANWRWSSDPNIMADDAAPLSSVAQEKEPNDVNQISNSLARLDSGTSDEGCPRDGSTGPTPPMSPVFRSLINNHLSGLITPFKALSPASSLGSHLGSVEDIPLARSMSLGHVLDHWIRSRSADSAVEVEDDSVVISPSVSPAVQENSVGENESKNIGVVESIPPCPVISVVGDGPCVTGDEGVACDVCDNGDVSKYGDGNWCNNECIVNKNDMPLPNGDVSCEETDSSQVFCECDESNAAPIQEVELRQKDGSIGVERRERRCGEVDGAMLLRRARGCGGVIGSPGVLQDIVDDTPCRKVLRTPSVVISDHSGDTISLTVALASSDFSIDKLDDKFHQPSSVSPASSSPSLCVNEDSSRKVSSCSSCSSVSTIDMTTPLTPMLTPNLDCLMEVPQRRISDCSTSSNISVSEDEIEQLLPRPPPPKKQSNWRKVRNIVQWTPFIQTYKKHKYPWVQLAGHQGNFRAGYKQGTILKKLCPAEEKALEEIMKDVLRPYVPLYMGVVEGTDSEKYLQLQDLLSDFELPCVMDIKMGVRTYLEDELAKAREKPKLRKDMYEKMVQIDPKAPTEAEHRAKAVTKPRYMVWRETISSTATQGFRIEGVRRGDGTSSKDFKTTRTREQVLTALTSFLQGYSHAATRYVQQLKSIKVTLEGSSFFNSHELIGSSLLFVHNETSASVRMIDFAKTIPLPGNVKITHRSPWSEGTHEDGYLLGLDNLIDLFSTVEKTLLSSDTNKIGDSNKTVVNSDKSETQINSSSSVSNDSQETNKIKNCSISNNSEETNVIKGTDIKNNSNNSTTISNTIASTNTIISHPPPTSNTHSSVSVNASLS